MIENMVDKEKIYIKKADIGHLKGILEVENSVFALPWSRDAFLEELESNEKAIYFVALHNLEIRGYLGFWKVLDEGQITNIAVHKDFQQKGIASALVNNMVNFAQMVGIQDLILEVRESNIKAQNLYKKFGFEIKGKRKKYYSDNGEDAYIMIRNKK